MSRILVLNSGSSSIKYQLINMGDRSVVLSGLVERIGEGGAGAVADHAAGVASILAVLPASGGPAGIGHRVVHGGERFSAPAVIDDEVVASIREQIPLAPLHNPANLLGIETARKAFPDTPQVAVFDTAFHLTMPQRAWRYALPRELADRMHIRRYGFHGTSHSFVTKAAAAHLGRSVEQLNLITLHLGNGASAAAVAGGSCIDTSMGLTPLEGLVMGTRSGDIDPAISVFLHREAGLSFDEIDALLNKRSGMLGLAGVSDMRDVERRAADGDEAAAEALDVYCYRVRKYVGAYSAALGRVDALVFTAGIGEHSPGVRAGICAGLGGLGVEIDGERNAVRAPGPRTISTPGSTVAVLVVPTNEELEIAEQTLAAVTGAQVAS